MRTQHGGQLEIHTSVSIMYSNILDAAHTNYNHLESKHSYNIKNIIYKILRLNHL